MVFRERPSPERGRFVCLERVRFKARLARSRHTDVGATKAGTKRFLFFEKFLSFTTKMLLGRGCACHRRGSRHFHGMTSRRLIFGVGLLLTTLNALGQSVATEETPTPTPTATPNVFSPQTLSDLKRIQQAALNSDYAYRQVAHLADNIGPRLSGSAQAAKAVEYVASELKAIGCEVQLEKLMVPHWVRGEETAELVQFPGQANNTTQKIVLCALGASVATPERGITSEVIAVRNFEELKSMRRDKVAGKIVLFDY